MTSPRIDADFHNADALGRLRLNCRGTLDDLSRRRVTLADGLRVTLSSEDVEAGGEVLYSAEEQLWTAVIDWDGVRRFDNVRPSSGVGKEGK